MNRKRENAVANVESLVLTYAVNALWMTAAIAVLATAMAGALRRASAAQQHVLWVVALVFAAFLPFAALREPRVAAATPSMAGAPATASAESFFHASRPAASVPLRDTAMALLVGAYAALVFARLFALVRAWRALPSRRALVQYDDVPAPFTAGIRRSLIVLPRWLRTEAAERRAAMRHEIAHIRRRDFTLNLAYELLLAPLAFHPAARFIKSQIDQTRELACDEIACASEPAKYAESLLTIAQSSVASGPAPQFALALFESDSLERRIRSLLDRSRRMSRFAGRSFLAAALALLASISVAAATVSVRVAASSDIDRFAGHWTGEFQGHRFFSMDLTKKGAALTGKIAHFSIEIAPNGDLTKAEERDGFTPIVDARVDGSVLHITGEDRGTTSSGPVDRIDLDLAVIARDRGEIRVPGGPVKPWPVRRQP
jgi:beta-lactamase regulating signal transducer with metallopeptidase domain